MQVADAPACKAFIGAIDAIRVTAADAQRDLALQQGARRSFTWDYVKRLPMVEEIPDAVRESMIAREAYLRDVRPCLRPREPAPSVCVLRG